MRNTNWQTHGPATDHDCGGADTGFVAMRVMVSAIGVLALAWGPLVRAHPQSEAPRLELIERFGTNQVAIHFNTAASKTYTLQAIGCLSGGTNSSAGNSVGGSSGLWTNLYVAPNLPFFNHYVIVDTRTNVHRFYRLRVTD